MALTLRQTAFVSAYVGAAEGNATRAAAMAGLKHPMQQGSRLLRNVEVQAAIREAKDAILAEGIAVREQRIARYNARWQQLQQVVAERATDPRLAAFAGGTTGLLTLEPQLVKVYNTDAPPPGDESDEDDDGETLYSAKRDRIVYVAKLDTGLLKEERELAKQAAQDAGQWQERRDGEQAGTTVNVNVSASAQTAVVTYDSFGRAFAHLAGLGDPGADGAAEPLDSAETDRSSGGLPHAAGS